MPSYTQDYRRIAVETPLGKDAVLLAAFAGREEISRLFRFELDLFTELDAIAPKDLIGKNVTIVYRRSSDEERFFNGFVSRITYRGVTDRFNLYSAQVVPWLWFLTRMADCRIFQNKSVKEILEAVFADAGFTDYETKDLKNNYGKREYCVQYRETAFNFVSRLMEEEGIFYFFRHENGKHTMVLADQKQVYKDAPEKEVQMLATKGALSDSDHILSWEHGYEFRPGKWAHTDYNFETPSTSLVTNAKTVVDLENIANFEMYDYPGNYLKKADGESLVKIRMQEEETPYDVVSATSVCSTFSPGLKFTLKDHQAASEEGKSFAITAIEHRCSVAEGYSNAGQDASAGDYRNSFTCIPDAVTFRPARVTPKPVIHGSQTAFVVGPDGEEIFPDKYGRVKVQFHWDRDGKKDEKSSCFVRVSQPWAGKNWGFLALPRVGHEVVVSFLEGDPDRPLITGSVYNAENMPPYKLPDNKTMSTVKSSSSKGSEGFNEIRFEDKKGEEQIFIHGEKQLDIRIKKDAYEWIGNDRHLIVKNNQIEHVEVDRQEIVDRDHQEKIGRDRHTTIEGKEAKEITKTLSLKVTGDVAEEFAANHSEQVTNDYYLKADNIVIEGMTNVTIKVGQSYIAIESGGIKIGTTGTIDTESTGKTTIKGTGGVEISGATVDIKADTTLTAKGGASAELSGPKVDVKADAMATVKGAIVMIN